MNFSEGLVEGLVDPLVPETDLNKPDLNGVTCLTLLKSLNAEAKLEPRLEQREEVPAIAQEDEEWMARLAEEHDDDVADLYGRADALEDDNDDVLETRETYDQWAERIYREFRARRQVRREEQSGRADQPEQAERSRPSKRPEKIHQKTEKKSGSSSVKYLRLLRLLDEGSTKTLKAKDFPFNLDSDAKFIVDTIMGESAENEAKNRLKKALLIWHPDKFMQKFHSRVMSGEKDEVKRLVTHVSQMLLTLKREQQ